MSTKKTDEELIAEADAVLAKVREGQPVREGDWRYLLLEYRSRLAEIVRQRGEVVAWMMGTGHGVHVEIGNDRPRAFMWNGQYAWKPLYTAPPATQTQQSAGVPDEEAIRIEFEQVARKDGGCLLTRSGHGYSYPLVHGMWMGLLWARGVRLFPDDLIARLRGAAAPAPENKT